MPRCSIFHMVCDSSLPIISPPVPSVQPGRTSILTHARIAVRSYLDSAPTFVPDGRRAPHAIARLLCDSKLFRNQRPRHVCSRDFLVAVRTSLPAHVVNFDQSWSLFSLDT
jgi:hypothetical protein